MKPKNYYAKLKDKLLDDEIGGLWRNVYEMVNAMCDIVIEEGKNPNDFLETIVYWEKELPVGYDFALEMFVSYPLAISRWLADLTLSHGGEIIFRALSEDYKDPLCIGNEAKVYVIKLLMQDVISDAFYEDKE